MPTEADDASAMTGPSNSAASGDASVSSSGHKQQLQPEENQQEQQKPTLPPATAKKKRNLPGTPDPDAEVMALSPRTLLATNRFLCEVCGKGFQRDQNLQLHRRGHNLPWKLKRSAVGGDGSGAPPARKKRVYVCPEETCVHHHPSRALGDLTGIKKHFSRKHGEKKWRCERCSKKYAVMSDWKAHCKTCGSREYRCDCGTVFNRRDSFITHRAFCDALAEETARAPQPPPAAPSAAGSATTEEVDPIPAVPVNVASPRPMIASPLRSPSEEQPVLQPQQPVPEKKELDATENTPQIQHHIPPPPPAPQLVRVSTSVDNLQQCQISSTSAGGRNNGLTVTIGGGGMFAHLFSPAPPSPTVVNVDQKPQALFTELAPPDPAPTLGLSAAAGLSLFASPPPQQSPSPHMSATALLQKAAQMGAAATNASLLRGFGLATSSSPAAPGSALVPDPRAGLSAGLALGLLPYESCAGRGGGGGFAELMMGGAGGQSSFCGPRPAATLDFLGLGMAGAGAGVAGGGLTALFTSITGAGLDLAPAGIPFGGDMSDRKSPTGLM